MRRYSLFSSILVVVIAALVLATQNNATPMQTVLVTDTVDGDTITIEGGERVRLLGIDTRERGELCYAEAKQFLAQLIEMKSVKLERDEENKDRYGRLLRHVWLNNTHINLEMVKQGYAIVLTIEPNVKYRQAFADAEKSARANNTGCLWKVE
jgi:micrococcal nuclease